MKRIAKIVRAFAANESGATAIEYGLIVSLIFLAIIGGMQAVSDAIIATYALIASVI